jgi:hypothetical protein
MVQEKNRFPRTFVRGMFAGRTFETRAEYLQALRATSANRKKRKPNRKPESTAPKEPSVRRIIEAYETLRSEGLGEAKATRLVEILVLGR